MIDSHTSLGIAQVVFYLPTFLLSIYLMYRNGSRHPRTAFWPAIPLTTMRLAGGAISISLEHQSPNVGLVVAAIVLSNVGVIPLLVQTFGLLRIILRDDLWLDGRYDRIIYGLRLCFIPAICFLTAGSSLSSSNRDLAQVLTTIGYIVFAFILVLLIAMQLYLWNRRSKLAFSSHKILKATLLAAPFLVARNVHGILEIVFENRAGSIWNPVHGSAVLFAFLALFTEYVALCACLYIGLSIVSDQRRREQHMSEMEPTDDWAIKPKSPSSVQPKTNTVMPL
ncbi:hypothetical protein K431DRAFT_254080 [Polychaeton citri CBS 116435]|uniref:DUF7702 domain-containing protein n=1 Tax=Polychaeton citri CBS 116435 TaxID=1314669 RepID=A0A9P4Q2F4_9PEZI|nr:hypothetical protein K431DRAFT_254080 [Polychaeton citri CBS 116435]